ncbi:RIP metalloprotease RseP [Primorskyibacter sp. S187A]|uniref:RIP metalloprotease RseP n=1 Tax=Primorskyibacter sp. S187A TaxID=3415130 RepID=UPI003C7E7A30
MDIGNLVASTGGLAYTLLFFVLALSIIVAVHEYGHYIVGRWSGIKADVFSVGFGPVIWSRVDKHGTQWQIAALPFGGYVKFAGDANAASAGADEAALAEMSPEDLRHTMHGAPLWARAATVAAGPIFNFILSILIFGLIFMNRGVATDPLSVGDLSPMPGALELSIGDEITAIGGIDIPAYSDGEAFNAFLEELPVQTPLPYNVIRDGSAREVLAPFPYPPMITQLVPQSAAFAAGLEVGDVITAIDGTPIAAFSELKDIVEGSDGRALALTVWRDGETLDLTMTPRRVDEPTADGSFQTQWRIGIIGGLFFEPATESPGFVNAFAQGAGQVWRIMDGSISGLYHMITGAISSCNLSGPIGIAQTSGQMASQGATSFIWFVAVLSTAVGFLNLFPIPVLDGGHLVFHAYEAVFRRPPPENFMRGLMIAGLTLVLSLMVFALYNDIFCP